MESENEVFRRQKHLNQKSSLRDDKMEQNIDQEQCQNSFQQVKAENQQNFHEYAQNLQNWLWQYRMWHSMNSWFPYYCMSFSQITSPSYSSTNVYQQPQQYYRQHIPLVQNQQIRQPAVLRTNLTGTEYVIPPLWKRVVAELLDFMVLFYIKVMLTIVIMRQLGYLKNENILDVKMDLLPVLDITELTEVDFDKAFSLTSEIIALEILNRILITLFETLCLRKGHGGTIGGATPGKRVFGLKVVSCEEVIDLRNGRLLVIPARDIGFLSALVRSVVKNFTMAFFFPACFTVFFFQHHRAAYDVLSKTIVVQNPPPVRQQ